MNLWKLLFVALIVLTGCQKKDDDEDANLSPPSALFAIAELLNPGTLEASTESEVKSYMTSDIMLYDNPPEEADDETCLGKKLDSTIIQTKGSSFKVEANIEFDQNSECGKEMGGTTITLETLRMKMQLYFYGICPGQDLGHLNGKVLATSDTTDVCAADDAQFISMAKIEFDVKGTVSGATFQSKSETLQGTMLESGAPCIARAKDADTQIIDGCLEIARGTKTVLKINGEADEDEGKSNYERLTNVGLEGPKKGGGLFYSGGKKTVRKNNWTGTVTYTAVDVEPKWEMKSDAGANVSGTVPKTRTALTSLDEGDLVKQQWRKLARLVAVPNLDPGH